MKNITKLALRCLEFSLIGTGVEKAGRRARRPELVEGLSYHLAVLLFEW